MFASAKRKFNLKIVHYIFPRITRINRANIYTFTNQNKLNYGFSYFQKGNFFWTSKGNKENVKDLNENNKNTEEEQNEKNNQNSISESDQTQEKSSLFDLNGALKYAEEKVKKGDFYSYVIGSALPPKLKPHFFAYHSFASEIMRSRYISTEPSVCRMRLMFWEDSLKELLEDKKINEPILILLKETFKTTSLRKETFFRMIDYLYYDLERGNEISTVEELEIFAENTRSMLLYLSLNLLHIDDREAYIAASHIGRGVGLVDILKRMPALQKMFINQIPSQLVEKYGASLITLWDRHGHIKDQFYDCILEIAAYAKKHIEIGRTYKDKLPKNTNVIFLQAVESYDWLLELEKYNFDVYEPKMAQISTRSVPKKMMELGQKGEY